MPPAPPGRWLVLNGGSSSVKHAVFAAGDPPARITGGTAAPGDPAAVLDTLAAAGHLADLAAVGHRIVHGGPNRFDPQLVTPALLADLRASTPLDPTHLPAELALIDAVAARLPGVPQVACFDTAFHQNLPAVARTLPLPREYADRGVRRYGFHGLSYQYLVGELARLDPAVAAGRVVFAHLGNGSSLAAVRNGVCVDTTMGFTPAGGLMMGTRTGDLDPGVLIHLARTENLTADQLDDLVSKKSGLLGVSGTSGDVRKLLAARAADPHASAALDLFAYTVRKGIGAMAAALGGLDALVFSGGIGEHAPEIRNDICAGLGFLGVALDPAANAATSPVISAGPTPVRVIRTDEELEIARTLGRLVPAAGGRP